MNKQNVLAIPCGDPAGIGVEILLKASVNAQLENCIIIAVGDEHHFRATAASCNIVNPFTTIVKTLRQCEKALQAGAPRILYHLDLLDMQQFRFGHIQGQCGLAAYHGATCSVHLVEQGLVDAIVTPPLHKEALKAAGIEHIGYTEMLASLSGSTKALTMFETMGMKIFFHTRHMSLLQACLAIDKEGVLTSIRSCYTVSQHPLFNQKLPLAVAALNPHASDGGLFGSEEEDAIIPAIQEAQREGMDVVGPIGADSVFHFAKMGAYRAVLSLYHDQGHIAAKTLDFERTVAVTWNLPFIRTSVDHGTAFDIAGKGVASEVSMVEAALVALRYLQSQRG
ncbi:MAG: 4-hydroxythreonine-4-phosphate dehydrogenase PdxA [Sphaerochaetaceae bacterium]